MQTFKFIYKVSTGECDPNFVFLIDAANEAEAIKIWKTKGEELHSNLFINCIRVK